MLPRYYDEFKKEFYETFSELLKIKNVVDPAELQGLVMEWGNALEAKWIPEPNELIAELENICEALYEISIGNDSAKDRLDEILDRIPDIFDSIYKPEDRFLSVVMIGRNEGCYLKEWIEYHLLAGAQHLYIYDHESTDNTKDVVAPYVADGTVTYKLIEGTHLGTQMGAYSEAVNLYKYDTEYMAFIDADEFLMPMKCESIPQAIKEIEKEYSERVYKWGAAGTVGGIGVNWRVFGTSGHQTRIEGLVTEEYTHRGPDELQMNSHIKTICNPRAVEKFTNPHAAIYKPGFFCISEHGSFIPWAFFHDSKGDVLRINHYYTRSEEEYKERRLGRKRDSRGVEKTAEEVLLCNDISDDTMARFVPGLKERMK